MLASRLELVPVVPVVQVVVVVASSHGVAVTRHEINDISLSLVCSIQRFLPSVVSFLQCSRIWIYCTLKNYHSVLIFKQSLCRSKEDHCQALNQMKISFL